MLDSGLIEHPGYLSALVAKGRCHLELDEPQAAREALERVVRQDATQAVASKLLVRAYIGLGELSRARERLSLYALLHETDPDIAQMLEIGLNALGLSSDSEADRFAHE